MFITASVDLSIIHKNVSYFLWATPVSTNVYKYGLMHSLEVSWQTASRGLPRREVRGVQLVASVDLTHHCGCYHFVHLELVQYTSSNKLFWNLLKFQSNLLFLCHISNASKCQRSLLCRRVFDEWQPGGKWSAPPGFRLYKVTYSVSKCSHLHTLIQCFIFCMLCEMYAAFYKFHTLMTTLGDSVKSGLLAKDTQWPIFWRRTSTLPSRVVMILSKLILIPRKILNTR